MLTTAPVFGSRISFLLLGCCRKSNMPVRLLARWSNEWSPIRPVRQLSSMNFRIELWSVSEWSTFV